MNSPLLEKSMDLSTQIVLFYEEFSKSKVSWSKIIINVSATQKSNKKGGKKIGNCAI